MEAAGLINFICLSHYQAGPHPQELGFLQGARAPEEVGAPVGAWQPQSSLCPGCSPPSESGGWSRPGHCWLKPPWEKLDHLFVPMAEVWRPPFPGTGSFSGAGSSKGRSQAHISSLARTTSIICPASPSRAVAVLFLVPGAAMPLQHRSSCSCSSLSNLHCP